jgi:hypothetical protein
MITSINSMVWASKTTSEDGEFQHLWRHQYKTSKLFFLSLISFVNPSLERDIGLIWKATLISTLKAMDLPLTRYLCKRTLLGMHRPLITYVKWQEKNTKSRVHLIRSKRSGKILILLWSHTKRHGRSKELIRSSPSYKTIWASSPLKRQVCSMKTSRMRYRLGKTIFKRFQKLLRC